MPEIVELHRAVSGSSFFVNLGAIKAWEPIHDNGGGGSSILVGRYWYRVTEPASEIARLFAEGHQ